MSGSWPINPDRITLRVCADLDWRVCAWCKNCRYGYDLNLAKAAAKAGGAVPIGALLKAGKITCRTRCDGLAADSVDVTAMNVGISAYVARFRASDVSGVRTVSVEGPQRG